MTPFITPPRWVCSGYCTTSSKSCNISRPRIAVSCYNCRHTVVMQVWTQLTKWSGKVYQRFKHPHQYKIDHSRHLTHSMPFDQKRLNILGFEVVRSQAHLTILSMSNYQYASLQTRYAMYNAEQQYFPSVISGSLYKNWPWVNYLQNHTR